MVDQSPLCYAYGYRLLTGASTLMLTPSPRCKAIVQRYESYAKRLADGRCQAYPDPYSRMGTGAYPSAGPDVSQGTPWTIGFGATGAGITRGVIWSLAQAETRFDLDIAARGVQLVKLLAGAKTTQNQFDAMTSWLFNEGYGNVVGSTLLRLHKAGDYVGAAQELPKWDKANGQASQGLLNRRNIEMALYLTA